MQEKYLNKDKMQAVLDSRPKGMPVQTAIDQYVKNGWTIEGVNDRGNAIGKARAAVDSVALGVGGPVLSAIDFAGKKLINKFGTEEQKQMSAKAPSLQDQFRQEFQTYQNPTIASVGELGGQVIGAAAPVAKVGNLVQAGSKAVGAGKLATNVAKGAAEGAAFTGYQGLSTGEMPSATDLAINTGAGIAFPVAGALVKGVSKTVSKVSNPSIGILEELKKIEGSKNSLRDYVSKQTGRGFNPADDIANSSLLKGSVDENGTIRTKTEGGAVEQYSKFLKPQEKVISDLLQQEGRSININDVRDSMLAAVNNSNLKGSAKLQALDGVKKEIRGLMLDADNLGNLPLSEIQKAKISKYNNVNFLNPETGASDKIIAKTLKEIVENNSTGEVKQLNEELARHYANIGYLEKLDGAKVDGGKLGKYFAKTIGGMVGSSFGPLGTIAGAETAGKLVGDKMAATFARSKGNLKMSDLMEGNLNNLQSLKNEGPLNTNQAITNIATKNPISGSIAQKEGLSIKKKATQQAMAGAPAGIETDENGNVNYDMWKAALATILLGGGVAGSAALSKALDKRKTASILNDVLFNKNSTNRDLEAARQLLKMKDSATKVQILKKAQQEAAKLIRDTKR